MSSLSIRRNPRSACESACSRSERVWASSALLQVISTVYWVSTSPEVWARLLSLLTMGRRKRLVAITRAAANTLGHQKPAPAKVPTIAEHQSVAAVLIPCTLIPSRRITPAPRKPMPEITCRHPRRVALPNQRRKDDKSARTEGNQSIGPESCHLLVPLALESN